MHRHKHGQSSKQSSTSFLHIPHIPTSITTFTVELHLITPALTVMEVACLQERDWGCASQTKIKFWTMSIDSSSFNIFECNSHMCSQRHTRQEMHIPAPVLPVNAVMYPLQLVFWSAAPRRTTAALSFKVATRVHTIWHFHCGRHLHHLIVLKIRCPHLYRCLCVWLIIQMLHCVQCVTVLLGEMLVCWYLPHDLRTN